MALNPVGDHQELFTTLDLSDSRVRGFVAGLRPYRQGSPRLEVELRQGRPVAHCYGHGGSGITMAWGVAETVMELLAPWLDRPQTVGVLGAGVIGLCTACCLAEEGHQVVLRAERFPPHTTSNVAGGLWAPTHVGAADPALHDRILRRSFQRLQREDPAAHGVEAAPLFEADDRRHALDPFPEGLVEAPRPLARLPFSGDWGSGRVSSTLLVETPRFLARLLERLRARGARCEERRLEGPADLEACPEPILVNCLGLGAREVSPDSRVAPIRGQLVLLDPAPRSFFLDHAAGYVISRRDVLVLGGTFEEGVEDPEPVPSQAQAILEAHRQAFGWSPGRSNR